MKRGVILANREEKNEKLSPIASIYEWVEVICTALFAVVILFTFVCRLVTVDGKSMMNTFHHGDRVIVSDLFYTPKCGDVVVIHDANSSDILEGPIIKRVIATAGETVDIDPETWQVTVTHVDGTSEVLEENYINRVDGNMRVATTGDTHYYRDALTLEDYPHTVEDGCVFVMGDNRNNSLDSRYLGDIDERMILGKAYVRLFPNTSFSF